MRSEANLLMRTPFKLLLPATWWVLFSTAAVFAQGEGPQSSEVPNSMGVHTWFIILAVGALLAWGISYSLQLQREMLKRKKGRDDLVRRKDEILDNIAELEGRKEAGEITEPKYNKELKELRLQLSRVVEQLGTR